MALIGNYTIYLKNPATYMGGTLVSNVRSAFNCNSQNRQRYYSANEEDRLPLTASLPTGTEPPYSVLIPYNGGELSSTTLISGDSDLVGAAAQGINIESDLDGIGIISNAALSNIVSLLSTLAGSGTLSATMVGTIQMTAALAGSGNITGAMKVLAGLMADLQGSGSVTSALRGTLSMSANIYVNQSEATVQQIVDAVWNALAAEYDLSGTMGEKLNGAGSAGDPWTTDISAYNTANTAGKILKERLSKTQFLGLK